MAVEIRILQSEDFPGCQAAEKSQLNLQVMVGIGSGSQECAKLFRGIENRISGRLRIVSDLLEVHIRKIIVYAARLAMPCATMYSTSECISS